jgi:hypothetical protein
VDHVRPPRDWLSPSLFVAAYPCAGARAAPDRRRLSEAHSSLEQRHLRANWPAAQRIGGALGFPGVGTVLGVSGPRGGRAFQLRKN